jgi:glycosyltransferase involved in cell wall biosynthesis
MWKDNRFQISVVMPCFNKAEYVEQALLSILEQEGLIAELILVDGDSSDESFSIAERVFAGALASKRRSAGWSIITIHERDRGQSHAINKGLLEASGEIVCWLNADDFYYPGALPKLIAEFHAHPEVGMIYGALDFIAADGSVIKGRPARAWNREQLLDSYCYIPQPSTFWRRSLIPLAGLIDTKLHFAMDYDYWLRLSLHTQVRSMPETLAGIRIMEGTKTGMSPLNAMPEALLVGRRHGANYFSKFRAAYWLWRMGAQGLVRYAAKHIKWQ